MIVEQVAAVVDDIGVDAVKIGMLGNVATIEAVAEALDLIGEAPVVLDPVMVAESGTRLLDEDARGALLELLRAAGDGGDPERARGQSACRGRRTRSARRSWRAGFTRSGPDASWSPVATARRRSISSSTANELVEIPGERHPDGAAHGSGCTHSSALAAQLALGLEPLEAAQRAKAIASEAVAAGLTGLGAGAGPVDVFGLAGRAAVRG